MDVLSEAVEGEGTAKAQEGLLHRLSKYIGVSDDVFKIIIMSFGCFMDALSDITFQMSIMFAANMVRAEEVDPGSGFSSDYDDVDLFLKIFFL